MIDGETGVLVDPRDLVEVADAIVGLLQDRELAARMGAAGSEHARALMWPEIAGRVEALITEIVALT